MTRPLTIDLPEYWHSYLQASVVSRRFASIEEAVEAGLQALQSDEERADTLDRLLAEGEASGDAGEWDYAAFKEKYRHAYRA